MKNLAIFYGGKSSEHDISIITALQTINSVDTKKFNIIPIYIDHKNNWCVPFDYKNLNIYTSDEVKGESLVMGIHKGHLIKKTHFCYKKYKKIDFAINCCHGINGEDGTLSGLLELGNIPYVGSGVIASAVGMDKVVMKDVFVSNNIPCAKYCYFYQNDLKDDNTIIPLAEAKLNYPIIVKPANLGSSIGINIAKNREELQKNIEIALNFDKKVILEEVIPNLREINCSCIGNSNNVEVSILEEPKNWKTFLDFNEKYLNGNKGNTKKIIDVKLNEDLENQIKNLSKKVFKVLGCVGVVRIDFLLNDKTNQVYVNEINTIPGSMANYLWQQKYTFTNLINKLLEYSEEEYLCKNKYVYAFESNVLKNFKGTKSVKLRK